METISVPVDTLRALKAYIEECEKKIEDEWGSCRELDELIAAGQMPPLYADVCALLEG